MLLLLCGSLSGRDFLLYKRDQNFSWEETSLKEERGSLFALLQQYYKGPYQLLRCVVHTKLAVEKVSNH